VFSEKASGARSDRAELAKLLKRLEPGDVVIVTRLDRPARSTRDLFKILDAISKAGAQFKSLGDTWADTTTPHGRLILTVLGGLAEFERELIRARTSEGRARAKERGVHMGRPLSLTPYQRQEVLARREAGETLMDIARSYRVATARSAGWVETAAGEKPTPGGGLIWVPSRGTAYPTPYGRRRLGARPAAHRQSGDRQGAGGDA
jgi:DNA invertase Pin-like site-specific DNA recombinase